MSCPVHGVRDVHNKEVFLRCLKVGTGLNSPMILGVEVEPVSEQLCNQA